MFGRGSGHGSCGEWRKEGKRVRHCMGCDVICGVVCG
jgi:hypothetical protein